MSETKYSWGPLKATWDKKGGYEFWTGAYEIRNSQGRVLAEIDARFYGDDSKNKDYQPTEEMKAIVAMFTAAPEMLAMLRRVSNYYEMAGQPLSSEGPPGEEINDLIDKATGGAIENE